MVQFYAPQASKIQHSIELSPEESKHATAAMRHRVGDRITVFDGMGKRFRAKITQVTKKKTEVLLEEALPAGTPLHVHTCLAQSLIPKESFDFLIEKATELGIDRIIPIQANRSSVKISSEKKFTKLDHWNHIALAACKQCDRSILPHIEEPQTSAQILRSFKDYDLILCADPDHNFPSIFSVIRSAKKPAKVLLLTGPEGGWEKTEVHNFVSNGATGVSLGNFLLKSETAALLMISALRYWEDQ